MAGLGKLVLFSGGRTGEAMSFWMRIRAWEAALALIGFDGRIYYFSAVVDWAFCKGFCENVVAECGLLMVRSWWNAGKRWFEDDLKSVVKNTPHFSDLFLCLFRFGKTDRRRGTTRPLLFLKACFRKDILAPIPPACCRLPFCWCRPSCCCANSAYQARHRCGGCRDHA